MTPDRRGRVFTALVKARIEDGPDRADRPGQ